MYYTCKASRVLEQKLLFATAFLEAAFATAWPLINPGRATDPDLLVAILSCAVCLPAATAEFLVSRAQNAPREMVVWNVAQLCRHVLMAVVFLRPVVYAAILASLTMSSYLVRRCLLTRRSCLSILVSSVHFMAYICVFCMMLVVHDAVAVVLLNALYWLPLRPDNVKQWTFDAFVLFFYCQSLHKSKRMSFSENI